MNKQMLESFDRIEKKVLLKEDSSTPEVYNEFNKKFWKAIDEEGLDEIYHNILRDPQLKKVYFDFYSKNIPEDIITDVKLNEYVDKLIQFITSVKNKVKINNLNDNESNINSYVIIYSMNHYTKVNAKDEEEAKQLLLSRKKNAKISKIMPASEFKRGTQNMNENLIYEEYDDLGYGDGHPRHRVTVVKHDRMPLSYRDILFENGFQKDHAGYYYKQISDKVLITATEDSARTQIIFKLHDIQKAIDKLDKDSYAYDRLLMLLQKYPWKYFRLGKRGDKQIVAFTQEEIILAVKEMDQEAKKYLNENINMLKESIDSDMRKLFDEAKKLAEEDRLEVQVGYDDNYSFVDYATQCAIESLQEEYGEDLYMSPSIQGGRGMNEVFASDFTASWDFEDECERLEELLVESESVEDFVSSVVSMYREFVENTMEYDDEDSDEDDYEDDKYQPISTEKLAQLKQLKGPLGSEIFNKIQKLIKECLKEGLEVEINIPKNKYKRLNESLTEEEKDELEIFLKNAEGNFSNKKIPLNYMRTQSKNNSSKVSILINQLGDNDLRIACKELGYRIV